MPRTTTSPLIGIRTAIFACLVFWVLSAAVLTHAYLAFTNRLYDNKQWTSTKTTLEKGVMGAYAFLTAPQALAHDRLNLGAWHGFQEVLYKDAVEPGSIDFDFSLSGGSYIVAVFNKGKDGFSGIRIGDAPYGSIYFTADAAGGFLTRTGVPGVNVHPKAWDHGRLEFRDGGVSFFLNGAPCGTFKAPFMRPGHVGFRGCAGNVLLDNVVIRGRDSREIVREDFSNTRHRASVFLLALAALGAVNAAAYLVLSLAGLPGRTLAAGVVCTGLSLFLVSCSLSAFWRYRSVRYTAVRPSLLEEERYYVNGGVEYIAAEIRERYALQPRKGVRRVLFIGTSQTWGAGAPTEDDTMVRIAEKELNRRARGKTKYECVNASFCGVSSDILFRRYADEWIGLDPEVVVINLGFNDGAKKERFSEYLTKFAALNRERGIRTIFVQEAAAHGIDRNTMCDAAREWNIPVIDLDGYIREKQDSGLIWWDMVHLTSYGQRLAGTYLAREIAKLLQ